MDIFEEEGTCFSIFYVLNKCKFVSGCLDSLSLKPQLTCFDAFIWMAGVILADEKVNKGIRLSVVPTTQLLLPSDNNELLSPKLSEPRHLYSLQRELGPQQAPRWPSECKVGVATVSCMLLLNLTVDLCATDEHL